MSLLGFDAIGRLALGQNPSGTGVLPAVYGGSFHIWDPAPRPKNFAKDWIAFAGNLGVETLPISSVFSPFDPPRRPRNFAKDFIAFSGNYYVETRVLTFFTPFSNPPPPPHFAKDWIAFSGSVQTEAFPTVGIDFMPFSPGRTAKLWGTGQPPPWWPYYFVAPFAPSGRDTHDGDWIPRRHHRPRPFRHPSVYSKEYYEALRKKEERTEEEEELLEEILQVIVPNLLIPLSRLIPPVAMPSLLQLPPYRPVPTLTMNPPPFHMATPEEIAADDEMIIRMLLEE
jgi:hypothetical protein